MSNTQNLNQSGNNAFEQYQLVNDRGMSIQPLFTIGIPISIIWSSISVIFNSLNDPHGPITTIVTYLRYVNILFIVFLGIIALLFWLKNADSRTKTIVLSMFAFQIIFFFGIFTAEKQAPFDLFRRVLASNLVAISVLSILLLIPTALSITYKRIETIIIFTSSINAIFSIIFQRQGAYGTHLISRGLFDQSSISSLFIVCGMIILLFRYNELKLPKILIIAILALQSIAILYLSSYLGLTIAIGALIIFFIHLKLNANIKAAVVLLMMSLVTFSFMEYQPSKPVRSDVINFKLTSIINTIITKDFSYINNSSTISKRWSGIISTIRQLPNHIFRGRGLDEEQIVIQLLDGSVETEFEVHTNFLNMALQASVIVGLSYMFFIFALLRWILYRSKIQNVRDWGIALSAIIIIGISSVTNAFDDTIYWLFVTSVVLMANPISKEEPTSVYFNR